MSDVRPMTRRIRDFFRDERGSAMTEFTMFLPVWITVMIGVINLGKFGMHATNVRVEAQKDLWNQAIAISGDFAAEGEHLIPLAAGIEAAAKYGELAGKEGNDQPVIDGIEAATNAAGLGLFGHYGESYEKTLPLDAVFDLPVEPEFQASEVLQLDDQSRYPHALLNDSLGDANMDLSGSSNILGTILGSLISASGFHHSAGAGIRYGSVFAEKSESGSFIAGRGNYTAAAHYDVLVPPRALTGAETELAFAFAFVLFKADERYGEYMQFGTENWGGDFGAADTPGEDEWAGAQDEADEDIEEQCKAICDSYDPDAENPGPQPAGYGKCNDEGYC